MIRSCTPSENVNPPLSPGAVLTAVQSPRRNRKDVSPDGVAGCAGAVATADINITAIVTPRRNIMVTLLRARASRIRCEQALNVAQGDVVAALDRDR